MSFKKLPLLLAFTICTTLGAGSAFANSEAFSKLTYKQAKEQAQKDGKILIVDFMATWCPPCKKMDKTTWVDPGVNEWIKKNAIAVQVDVDQDAATTSELNVDSMPTIVLFKPDGGGKEFARESGYQDPTELLNWLEGVKSGKSAESLKEESSQAGGGGMWERLNHAQKALATKKYDEAEEEFLWLWNNLKGDTPVVGELRKKVIPIEVHQLLKKFPEGKGHWIALRDEAGKANKREDWLALNMILDDNAASLAWFDKAKTDPAQRKTFESLTSVLEYPLFSDKRFADAAEYLYPNPIEKVQAYHKAAKDMMQPRADTEFAKNFNPFPPMILMLYYAYLGAGRDGEAKKIYDECIRLDDSPTMRAMLESVNKSMEPAKTKAGSSAK